MIKGKYVATVEIDFEIDENDPTFEPFDRLRDAVRNDLTPCVHGVLEEEFGEFGKVAVNQLYADVYQAKEESQ